MLTVAILLHSRACCIRGPRMKSKSVKKKTPRVHMARTDIQMKILLLVIAAYDA